MISQELKHFYFIREDETISYSRQLREYTGSITATILMQRLELHFKEHPDGFNKFLSASSKIYKHKDSVSWQEELNCSKEEFVAAFNQIGMRHRTRTRYQATLHPFYNSDNEEKYYCSYHDNHTGLTWYFRNHFLVDSIAKKLLICKD